jgi:chemotaxis protein histidine kinase CheA
VFRPEKEGIMEDPIAAIRETFFQECEEQLAELETGLIAMENGTAEAETVNAVFRAVHSMKGGAGIFSLDALVRFAHVFETVLDKVRSGTLATPPAVLGVFLRAADVLADLVRAARENGKVDEARTAAMVAEFDRSTMPAMRRRHLHPSLSPPRRRKRVVCLRQNRMRRRRAITGRSVLRRVPSFTPRPMRARSCCANCAAWVR